MCCHNIDNDSGENAKDIDNDKGQRQCHNINNDLNYNGNDNDINRALLFVINMLELLCIHSYASFLWLLQSVFIVVRCVYVYA